MLSKLVKYNLDKKLQIYLVGQPVHATFFLQPVYLPTEDEMNLFTIVTVERITFFRQSCFCAHVILISIISPLEQHCLSHILRHVESTVTF